ncbi:MAG: hypothetical protein ACREIU_00290 [Planctomycetota bacterium]
MRGTKSGFLTGPGRPLRALLPALLPLCAAWPASGQRTSLGGGCPFPGGAPLLLSCGTAPPKIGTLDFEFFASGIPPGAIGPELFIGGCAAPPVPPPAFASMCSPGAPGCLVVLDLAFEVYVPFPVLGPGGFLPEWSLAIPNDPSLVGASFCTQAVAAVPSGGGFCIALSNGFQITLLP